jgi:large subunit ribosomal protein L21
VYAIVRSGGRQHKVSVGDVVQVDRIVGSAGTPVELKALLVVDGDSVTSDAWVLEGVKVHGEIVAEVKAPKIDIIKFKNKTGYRVRQGHRQKYTQVKVTSIDTGKK